MELKTWIKISVGVHVAAFAAAAMFSGGSTNVDRLSGLGTVELVTVAGSEAPQTENKAKKRSLDVLSVNPQLSAENTNNAKDEQGESAPIVAGNMEGSSDYSGTGGATSDDLARFKSLVLTAIEKAKYYPRFAKERGYEGVVGVRFVVEPDGRVREVTLTRPCHCDALNVAAADIVKKAAPFSNSQIPGSKSVPFDVDISFKLD